MSQLIEIFVKTAFTGEFDNTVTILRNIRDGTRHQAISENKTGTDFRFAAGFRQTFPLLIGDILQQQKFYYGTCSVLRTENSRRQHP